MENRKALFDAVKNHVDNRHKFFIKEKHRKAEKAFPFVVLTVTVMMMLLGVFLAATKAPLFSPLVFLSVLMSSAWITSKSALADQIPHKDSLKKRKEKLIKQLDLEPSLAPLLSPAHADIKDNKLTSDWYIELKKILTDIKAPDLTDDEVDHQFAGLLFDEKAPPLMVLEPEELPVSLVTLRDWKV